MEVILKPLTEDNISDVLAHSDSSSKFCGLPSNNEQAERYLETVTEQRQEGYAQTFNVYNHVDQTQLVGGGQVYNTGETCGLGWWVVQARRRQGYGKAIARALENEAGNLFPDFRQFRLLIYRENEPSLHLARSMGYVACTENTEPLLIYGKQRIDIS